MKFFICKGHEVDLTKRETQIAALVARAKDRKTISSELKISVRTVDDFLEKLRRKFNVVATPQLIFVLAKIPAKKLDRIFTA